MEAASEKLWFMKGCLPRWKRCSFGNGNCLPNHLCNVSLMNVVNNVSARTTGNPPACGVSSRLPEHLSTQFEVWSGRRSLTPTDLSLSALHWAAIRVELSLTAGFNTAIMPQTDRQMTYKHKYINTHMHTHLHCSHTAENHLHCTRFFRNWLYAIWICKPDSRKVLAIKLPKIKSTAFDYWIDRNNFTFLGVFSALQQIESTPHEHI